MAYFGLQYVEIWLQRSCLHREQRLKTRLRLAEENQGQFEGSLYNDGDKEMLLVAFQVLIPSSHKLVRICTHSASMLVSPEKV